LAKVRERQAREIGFKAGKKNPLERQNPGEQRGARGLRRGRSTDSQREQGPEAESNATYRDFIVGLHIRKRHVGNGSTRPIGLD
jgi:hypothetical protein